MGEIILEEKYILEYVKDMINSFKIKNINVNDAKFHHNTSYKLAPSILKHGILTIVDSNKLGITNYTEKELKLMSDTDSHVNGIDSISLSIPGLTDLYKDEMEYSPFKPTEIDLLISNDVKASRTTTHYGNEYLSHGSILVDKIKSIDIRLVKLIEEAKSIEKIKVIIEKYNYLIGIAKILKELNLDMPIRDMSNENLTLDTDAISNIQKIILK